MSIMVFGFELQIYFSIVLFAIILSAVLVNRYWFQLLASLDIYIETFTYRKKQFLAKYQVLKFYAEYVKVIIK